MVTPRLYFVGFNFSHFKLFNEVQRRYIWQFQSSCQLALLCLRLRTATHVFYKLVSCTHTQSRPPQQLMLLYIVGFQVNIQKLLPLKISANICAADPTRHWSITNSIFSEQHLIIAEYAEILRTKHFVENHFYFCIFNYKLSQKSNRA